MVYMLWRIPYLDVSNVAKMQFNFSNLFHKFYNLPCYDACLCINLSFSCLNLVQPDSCISLYNREGRKEKGNFSWDLFQRLWGCAVIFYRVSLCHNVTYSLCYINFICQLKSISQAKFLLIYFHLQKQGTKFLCLPFGPQLNATILLGNWVRFSGAYQGDNAM